MSTKHTAEPWRSNIFGIYGDVEREEIMVAHVGISADRRIRTDENIANAARIVQCVNACQGIPDPAAALQQAREDARSLQMVREALETIARGNTDPDDMVAIALSAVQSLGGFMP